MVALKASQPHNPYYSHPPTTAQVQKPMVHLLPIPHFHLIWGSHMMAMLIVGESLVPEPHPEGLLPIANPDASSRR